MKQEKRTINGVEYTFQSIPFYSYLQLVDRHKNKNGIVQQAPYIKELIEHVVVDPKVSVHDFDDDFEAAVELVNEIEGFLKSKRGRKSVEEESQE